MKSPAQPASTLAQNSQPWPAQIDRYRVRGILGTGGMGQVYRAYDPQLDRLVALKRPHFGGPPEDVKRRMERFQREARAGAQVLHPNVCPIFDVGEHEGRPYVVMALVEGRSLAAHPGPADCRAAVALVRQVLDGLGAIHARGIIHRDIKPANILLDAAGQAILTDFGLARHDHERSPITSEGAILGTPCYMAPEQADGRSGEIGPWTDLYAVGVVLYEMLVGRPPYQGTTPAVLAQILRDEPMPPRSLRPDLDPALEAIVLRSMQKEPARRFQNTAAFAAALDAWASAARTGEAPQPTATEATAVIGLAPPRRRGYSLSRLAGLLAGGLLLAAGMGLVALGVLGVSIGGQLYLLPIPAGIFAVGFSCLGFAIWKLVEAGNTGEGLCNAAAHGNRSTVQRGLTNGVPPDGRDEMDETALMHAAAQGHTDIVKLLLLYGADPGLKNRFGQSAVEIARANGQAGVVAVLDRASPPGSAAVANLPRFDLGFGLLGAALVGALAVCCLLWWINPGSTPISLETLTELLDQKQVASLWTAAFDNRKDTEVGGEIKDSNNPLVLRLGLGGRKFVTEMPLSTWQSLGLKRQGVPVAAWVGDHRELRAPNGWQAALMLAIPLAVAAAVGRFHKAGKGIGLPFKRSAPAPARAAGSRG